MSGSLDLVMFAALICAIITGFPVAFSIAGVAVAFAYLGWSLGVMDIGLLGALAQRAYGLIGNTVLIAIPVFVLMGAILATLGMSVLLLLEEFGLLCRLPEHLLDGVGQLALEAGACDLPAPSCHLHPSRIPRRRTQGQQTKEEFPRWSRRGCQPH
jgi:hypothetical protein